MNGNMVSDANKGIIDIAYNHLNLPTTVQIGNGPGAEHNGTENGGTSIRVRGQQ